MSSPEEDDGTQPTTSSSDATQNNSTIELTQEQVQRIKTNRKRALEIKNRKEETAEKV